MANQSETIGALAAALAKAQGSLNAALKDSKKTHISKTNTRISRPFGMPPASRSPRMSSQ